MGNYSSLDYPGAIRTVAFGINNNGEIVGAYTNTNGNSEGLMMN